MRRLPLRAMRARCHGVAARPLAVTALVILGALPVHAAPSAVLPVYLDGGGAPAPLVSRIEERLRAALTERGFVLASEPPSPPPVEPRVVAVKSSLEKGIVAYRALQLDPAVAALTAAEAGALAVPESLEAPRLLADARIYLGIIALATGKEPEALAVFRKVAATDPERRLDGKLFPPDAVAIYEHARKEVAAGSFAGADLQGGEGASTWVDGKPVTGKVRLSYGEHLFLATSEGGTAAAKIEVAEANVIWTADYLPDPAAMTTALRLAAKRGDEPGLTRAMEALAVTAGANRVLLWDLRSGNGKMEAPLRLHDAASTDPDKTATADLGAGAGSERGMKMAVAALFGAPVVVGVLAPVPPAPAAAHHSKAWIWWTAGGLVLLAAAGGAAAAYSSQSAGAEKVGVVVQH